MAPDSPADLRQAALAYLARHRVLTLATTGPLGPWAAAVFYVNDDFDLLFLSAGHTRHGQNLAANPRAAGAIQEDYEDWPAIQGIQLEGEVIPLTGHHRAAAVDLYRAKYPFINAANPQIRTAMERVNWYRLAPDRLYFIDNSQGLGHRDEIALISGAELR